MSGAEAGRPDRKDALLAAIRDFFEDQATAAFIPPPPADESVQVAAAALMVLLVRADHESRQDEHRVLERGLQRTFALTADQTAMLVRTAEAAIGDGARFAEITSVLETALTNAEKKAVVLRMWRIAFADAELQAHEEYLVRKTADLLGLSAADLVETKVQAREGFLGEDL